MESLGVLVVNTTPLYPAPVFNDLPGMFQYAQSVFPTGQVIVMVVFFVAFFALKRYESLRAFSAAAFITAITAIILFALGMVQDYFVYAGVVATMAGILLMYFKGDMN